MPFGFTLNYFVFWPVDSGHWIYFSFQAKKASAQEASLVAELGVLEKAIEGRQFVAHANSILETEATTEKVVLLRKVNLALHLCPYSDGWS